jgi:hypothetical protein
VSNQPDDTARLLRGSSTLGLDVYRSSQWGLGTAMDLGLASMLWRQKDKGIVLTGPTAGLLLVGEHVITGQWWLVARAEGTVWFADRVETTRERVYFDKHSSDSKGVDIVTTQERLQTNWMGALSIGLCLRWGEAR